MRFRFVMSQVGRGLVRNFAMTVAIIIVTFISLLFVGAGILLQLQIGELKTGWYDKVEISISMCTAGDRGPCKNKEASEQDIKELGEFLNSEAMKPYVKKVYFQSKEDAFKEFQERFGNSPIATYATPDILPASYKVKLVNPRQYGVIDQEVSGKSGVHSVIDQKAILEPLFVMLNRATALSLGLAGLMIVAAVLLVGTTIRLSAMMREKETSIMRLVGATKLFIQLPFILEGAVAALIGGLLAVGGLAAGIHFIVQGWLQQSFPWMSFVSMSELALVGPIIVVAAIALAAVASGLSLARYTKV